MDFPSSIPFVLILCFLLDLSTVDHPAVLKLYDTFESRSHMFIVTQLVQVISWRPTFSFWDELGIDHTFLMRHCFVVQGGDLFSRIQLRKRFTEQAAMGCTWRVCPCLILLRLFTRPSCCWSRQVVHYIPALVDVDVDCH